MGCRPGITGPAPPTAGRWRRRQAGHRISPAARYVELRTAGAKPFPLAQRVSFNSWPGHRNVGHSARICTAVMDERGTWPSQPPLPSFPEKAPDRVVLCRPERVPWPRGPMCSTAHGKLCGQQSKQRYPGGLSRRVERLGPASCLPPGRAARFPHRQPPRGPQRPRGCRRR